MRNNFFIKTCTSLKSVHYVILAICLFNFENCFTIVYTENFEPKKGDDYSLEFVGKNVYPGTVTKASETNYRVEVKNILKGKNRLLIIEIDLINSKAILSETQTKENFSKKEDFSSFVYFEIMATSVFDNQHRYVNIDDLKIGKEFSFEQITAIQIFQNISLVNLVKTKNDPARYKKITIPIYDIRYSDNLEWQERNRLIWNLKKTGFYAGFLISVPLDLVTGIFQAAYYLLNGGGVK